MNNFYRLILTDREYHELASLALQKRDCNLFNALEWIGTTYWDESIYEVESHIAWAIKTASEHPETGFVMKWNTPLGMKIHQFLASIQCRKVA